MPAKPDEKITFLSQKRVKWFKVFLIILGLLLAGVPSAHLVLLIMGKDHPGFFTTIYAVAFINLIYHLFKRMKAVEFDRSYLYVTEKGFDVIVPLANIKKVEIRNLAGIYEITFFDKIQSGDKLFFKPSLIYPLDYNKQDEKVNKLRDYAWKARGRMDAGVRTS